MLLSRFNNSFSAFSTSGDFCFNLWLEGQRAICVPWRIDKLLLIYLSKSQNVSMSQSICLMVPPFALSFAAWVKPPPSILLILSQYCLQCSHGGAGYTAPRQDRGMEEDSLPAGQRSCQRWATRKKQKQICYIQKPAQRVQEMSCTVYILLVLRRIQEVSSGNQKKVTGYNKTPEESKKR